MLRSNDLIARLQVHSWLQILQLAVSDSPALVVNDGFLPPEISVKERFWKAYEQTCIRGVGDCERMKKIMGDFLLKVKEELKTASHILLLPIGVLLSFNGNGEVVISKQV